MEIGRRDAMGWVSGSTDEGHAFEAKVYDGQSVFGVPTERFLEGGNVSKLYIRDEVGRQVYLYDRGYCYGEAVRDAAASIVRALEERFCDAGE